MERHRIACAVWLAIVGTLASTGARAQEGRRFVLEWSAPEGCPDARTIEDEILRLAGREPATPMRVRAAITREGERFRIELATSSTAGDGTRTIEGASCEAIAEAGALVIAMAIDPEAALRAGSEAGTETGAGAETASGAGAATASGTEVETGAASGTGAGTETASGTGAASESVEGSEAEIGVETETGARSGARTGAEAGTAEMAPTETEGAAGPAAEGVVAQEGSAGGPRSAPGVSFLAAGLATVGVGALPSPSPGAGLAIGIRIDALELWAGGSWLAEQGAEVDTYRASFWQATARVRGCVPIALGTPIVELAPCAGVELGAIQGTPAADVPRRAAGTSIWSALELVVDLRAWITRELGVTLAGALEIPFVIERFVVRAGGDARVLHRPSDAAFLGTVGLVVRLP